MATTKNSTFGKISGKVGEAVAYELNGQMVLRSLGKPRKDKPTEKQLINRKKFACTQNWLQPITIFLRTGFMDYQPTFEGFVAAKSYNHRHAVQIDENNEFFINPALALVSFGSQPLPSTASAVCTDQSEILFTWSTEGEYNSQDIAMILLYDIKAGFACADKSFARRSRGTASYKLSEGENKSEYHIYLSFIADDRKSRSNSMYLGSLVLS